MPGTGLATALFCIKELSTLVARTMLQLVLRARLFLDRPMMSMGLYSPLEVTVSSLVWAPVSMLGRRIEGGIQ